MGDGAADPTRADAPASGRWVTIAAILGAAGFALACLVVDKLARAGFYGTVDDALFMTPYWDPAKAILSGAIPYRDIAIEYPPLSLPVFLLPALIAGGGRHYLFYRPVFEALMAGLGAAIVPVVAWTLHRLAARRSDVALAVALLVASPLLIGPLIISRYDVWPALLAALSVAFAVSGRRRWAFAFAALGTVAKVYPAVLLPILAIEAWRNASRREAAIGVGVFVLVAGVVMAPFVAADPAAALDPYLRSLARPLQVESLGASVIVLAHHLFGLPIQPIVLSFGSYNLDGSVPMAVASIQSILMVAGVVGTWVLAARGRLTPGRVALASAAAITLEIALGKVFSPQYVIWLLPALAVIAPVLGPRAIVALGAILGLTSLYYPGRYTAFIQTFDLAATLAILQRNLGVLAFGIYLALLLRRTDPDDGGDPRP